MVLHLMTVPEELRRRNLRRMKAVATGLLVLAAVIYVVTWRVERGGGPGWVSYLRAAAEAGVIGGLADWFAVTALFRRPLGLPIPHTAIIPTRKDALGRNLGDFVGTNFLSEEVVRDRLHRADVAGRLGSWLAEPAHAERVTAEVSVAVRSAMDVLRDEDVHAVLERAVLKRLAGVSLGPPLGHVLERIVADGAHHRLVDVGIDRLHNWLAANRETMMKLIIAQAPLWSPDFLDQRVATRVYAELVRVSGEVVDDPNHAWRQGIDRFLATFADDLRTDPATIAHLEDLTTSLLEHPEIRRAFGDLVAAGRSLLLELIDDPTSELRLRATDALVSFGGRLAADPVLAAKANRWLQDAAGYVVTHYRDELTRTITDTVERWDADETSRKVELQVGGDLQYIRINGTLVGSLAGLAIHAVTRLVL
ncbi:MAG: DUF445 domain-containing protein [Frankiaceae bacterium]